MKQDSLGIYSGVAYGSSWRMTAAYSTSFSTAVRLLARQLRPHIAAVYGLVRLADEIVDSWEELDQAKSLDELEAAVGVAIRTGFSLNPLIHAYVLTARQFQFESQLLDAFFTSMRLDLMKRSYSQSQYEAYIYGSAEVVGLMCLAIFVNGDGAEYKRLRVGAQALGAAFQKVNFLRDYAADNKTLGRIYFPEVSELDDTAKRSIEADIRSDLINAREAVDQLPATSRRGVKLALRYYEELLVRIEGTSAEVIAEQRIRISNSRKGWLYLMTRIGL